MSEHEVRPKATIRKLAFLGSFIVSVGLYKASQDHAFPVMDEPWNLNEHAKHISGGISLSFGIRYVMENIKRAREWAFATAIVVTSGAGVLFEKVDVPWYRDTTLDMKDAGYMAVSSICGALLMKNQIEVAPEAAEILEINPLQTD